MDKLEQLEQVFHRLKHDEKVVREKITDPDNIYFFVPQLEGSNKTNVAYAIFVEKDYDKAKQYCYNAARIAEFMSVKYNWRIIESGIERISYALLSDNEELIKRYSVLRNPINDMNWIGYQLSNAVQNTIIGNWERLEENIRRLERFVKSPSYKWYLPTVGVFEGFIKKDQKQIEASLKELLKTHKKRNKELLISNDFLSVDTSGFCKLAWRLGYQIDLKNPLIPQELMPIQPLAHYQEYDFLKEIS